MGGFTNAVVGGAETLIRTAIKSANYVAGLAGWRITKTGSAEFSNITARGTVIANNGSTVIDVNGITVTGTSHKWQLNAANGFIAQRIPDDGTESDIFDAGYFMSPRNPSPINAATLGGQGKLYADILTSGSDEAGYCDFISPVWTGKPSYARLLLLSQSILSATDNSEARLVASKITHNGFTQGNGIFGYGGGSTVSFNTTAETVVLVSAFSYAFKAGWLYRVRMRSAGSVGTAPNRIISRLRVGTGTGGAVIDSTGHQFANTGGGNENWETLFTCTANQTTALTWTGATGTAFVANFPTPVMEIEEIGLASDTGINSVLPSM